MTDTPSSEREKQLRAEITRLNKIVTALMNRAERSTTLEGSDFSVFQTTIMLEEQVHRRTSELEAALRENEHITRSLRESEARFRGLVGQSLVGIGIIEDGKFSYANPKLAQMFGRNVEEMVGLSPVDLATSEDRQLVTEQLRRRMCSEVERVEYSFRATRKDGTPIEVECHSSVMTIRKKPVLISLLIDVTERVRTQRELQSLQEQLREQAIHDHLTGLYNRRYLDELFHRELLLARRNGYQVSIVIGDIDHFKGVNDQYGHLAGDEVLRQFARLVRQSYRTTDLVCRYGGEEFLVVLPAMEGDSARDRTEKLRRLIQETPIVFGEASIRITASFGIASFPADADCPESLLARADNALYKAKANGRNQVQNWPEHESTKPEAEQGEWPNVPDVDAKSA